MSTSAGKIMIFRGSTEKKHLRAVFCCVQKVAPFVQAPIWLFLCSFSGSYYCWEETDVLFLFSFFHPSEYLPPRAPRHYAAKLVDAQIVPANGELGHYRECRQRRPSSCLGAAFDGRTSGPSRSFRAYTCLLRVHAAFIPVLFKSSAAVWCVVLCCS